MEFMYNVGAFINSFIGAIVGVFLYPLANLVRLGVIALSAASLAILAIPVLSIAMGVMAGLNAGIFPGIAASIISLIGLTTLTSALLITLSGLASIHIAFASPWKGMRIGWEHGLIASLGKMLRMCFGMADSDNNINEDFWGITQGSYQTAVDRLVDRAVMAARRPLTEAEFSGLELSASELNKFKEARQPLLANEELARLELSGIEKAEIERIKALPEEERNEGEKRTLNDSEKLQKALTCYKNLIQRLEKDACPILQDRPDRASVLLLAKQYKDGDNWLPVPGFSHVFDRAALKTWLVGSTNTPGNAVHPLDRSDFIKNPSRYTLSGTEYRTRYIIYSYYPDGEESPGVSQEINLLNQELRAYLVSRPAMVSDPQEHGIPPVLEGGGGDGGGPASSLRM